MKKTACDSARTSVRTALMSIAMASILKVFFMRKKEGKGKMLSKREKSGRRSHERSKSR
jgi:hypothetical protein